MNCPKCNKQMEEKCIFSDRMLFDGTRRVEVLGRCEDCDFDATWTVEIKDLEVTEYNFERYFFG